jgi:hypothetical protein
MLLEAKLTKKIKLHLESLSPDVWFYKSSDRYTSGIPDVIGCCRGVFFGIEIKAPGKAPRKLQAHVLDMIKRSGGSCICVDSFTDYKQFMDDLL